MQTESGTLLGPIVMSRDEPANTAKLGQLVKEYKKSSANVAKVIVASLVSGLIAALFFTGSISNAAAKDLAGTIALSIIGLLFLLPPAFGVYMLMRGRGARLFLYDNGLIYRGGGQEVTTAWDEIASYLQETACRITKQDGAVIEFGLNIQDANEVVQKIQEETLRVMLPRARTTIRNGSSIQFKGLTPAENAPLGKALNNFMKALSGFTVDARGIAEIDSGKRIEWSAVTDFGIDTERMGASRRESNLVDVFFIQDGNNRFRTRYGLLENAHVLVALCGEMAATSSR
jgi:hypothetical protein